MSDAAHAAYVKRRLESHRKDLAVLNAKIPRECPLRITGSPTTWRFYTNTGKGPLRFEVATAYIDGYLAAWEAVL